MEAKRKILQRHFVRRNYCQPLNNNKLSMMKIRHFIFKRNNEGKRKQSFDRVHHEVHEFYFNSRQ